MPVAQSQKGFEKQNNYGIQCVERWWLLNLDLKRNEKASFKGFKYSKRKLLPALERNCNRKKMT